MLALIDGAIEAARARCSSSRRGTPRTSFPAHTHTQPAQPTTIAHYLLAVIEQLERDTVRLRAALRQRQPQSARRVRDHRHRLSDRSRSHERRCSASTARPATPTAASPPSTTCSRAYRRPRCCSSASDASCRTCCSGARARSATCACRTASCSAAASCRRSAIPSRSSTRARSPARRWGRPWRSCSPSTTRRSATSSTPKTISSRWSSSMFRDAMRGRASRGVGDGRAQFDTARMAERASDGLDHRHRARRHAGARSRCAVQVRPRDRLTVRLASRGADRVRRCRPCCARPPPTCWAVRSRSTTPRLAHILSPRHFVEVRTTPGGPAPSESVRAIAASRPKLSDDEEWLTGTVERAAVG